MYMSTQNSLHFVIPMLRGVKILPEDISLLTETRQKILVYLLKHGGSSLSPISEKTDESIATLLKAIQRLKDSGFVQSLEEIERGNQKIDVKNAGLYELTRKGKFLALMIAEPNGVTEEEYKEMIENFLKHDVDKNIAADYRYMGTIIKTIANTK